MLTQERLKELLHYNPETGDFTRLTRAANCVKVGDLAGWVQVTHAKKRYILLKVDRKQYQAHRLAFLYMTSEMPSDQVDHVNGNGLDNRWTNLRKVTSHENQKNRRLYENNSSGVCGVSWYKKSNKWVSCIAINGRNKHLGYFDNMEDAIAARESANTEYGFHTNHGSDRPL